VAIAKSDDVEQQLHRKDNDEGATAVAQSSDDVVSASISEQQPCRRDDDKGATANAPSSDNEDDDEGKIFQDNDAGTIVHDFDEDAWGNDEGGIIKADERTTLRGNGKEGGCVTLPCPDEDEVMIMPHDDGKQGGKDDGWASDKDDGTTVLDDNWDERGTDVGMIINPRSRNDVQQSIESNQVMAARRCTRSMIVHDNGKNGGKDEGGIADENEGTTVVRGNGKEGGTFLNM